MMRDVLTKSKYCDGVECVRRHWLSAYKPTAAEPTGDSMRAESGKEVGKLAREYFGNPSLVTWAPQHEMMVQATRKLMSDGNACIAEASFMVGDLFCSVDILRKTDYGWDLIEVKSGTEVTLRHENDVAFQCYVLHRAGIPVDHVYLMHVNSGYVRGEELDLEQFFLLEDVTEIAKGKFMEVGDTAEQLIRALWEEDEPVVPYGEQCDQCPYHNYCLRDICNPSVLDIAGMRKGTKYGYLNQGIVSFKDLLEKKVKLTARYKQQVEVELGLQPEVCDVVEIGKCLKAFTYPMYHLDFETYNPTIPPYAGTKPYQQIPFQYSLHVQREYGGELEHYEHLAYPGADPRRVLAEQLCRDIPKDVCIIAYNMRFEKGVIRALAEVYPDLSEHLMNIHDHLVDLMVPFQKRYYYSKALQGSFSIKYVLPALCPGDPELNYKALDGVHNGVEASNAFFAMASMKEEEVEQMRKSLLAYCRLDTLAMVKVYEKLVAMCDRV